MLHVAAVSLLAFILAMTSSVSLAETTIGLANAEENPLIVRGTFQKGQAISNLFGNLLLKTSSDVKIDLNMRSTHLTLEGNDQIIINRADVTIPTGIKIDPGAVQDVRITVANIPRPGHYKGTLTLWANSEAANALNVRIEVEVGIRPMLAQLGTAPQWNLIRCDWAWTCWIAREFISNSATADKQPIRLENQSPLPAQRIDMLVLLRGTNNKSNDVTRDVSLGPVGTIPGSGIAEVPITINYNALAADTYDGSVRFRVPATDEALTVPLIVNVRDGPILPLLLILAGVIVGRWARGLDSPAIKAQMKALQRLYGMRSDMTRVRNAVSASFLKEQADLLEHLIEKGSATEQQLVEKLNQLDEQVDVFARLDLAEVEALKIPGLSAAIATDLTAARNTAMAGDRTKALENLEAIMKKVRYAAASPQPALQAPDIRVVFDHILLSLTPGLPASQRPAIDWSRTWSDWFARFIAVLSGDSSVGTKFRFWILRPVLGLALLMLLCLTGLYTLYIKAPTFGSAGMYEYLGLFVWGLGAEAAQRALTSLKLPTQ